MEAKKYLIPAIAIAVLAIGGGVAFWKYRDIALKNSADESYTSMSMEKTTLVFQDRQITDNTAPLRIAITYPYVEGMVGFNAMAEAAANIQLGDFKKNSLENDQAIKEVDPEGYAKYPREYTLDISYDQGLLTSDTVSAILRVANYTGGAHGAQYFVPLNYSVKDARPLTVADIFPNDPNYLQTISEFCTTELTKQIDERGGTGAAAGSWITDGAGPVAENFQDFLLQDETVTFYFPQYQVAAYALGDFQVVMPRPSNK